MPSALDSKKRIYPSGMESDTKWMLKRQGVVYRQHQSCIRQLSTLERHLCSILAGAAWGGHIARLLWKSAVVGENEFS